jgi:uroporphyrinogen decarboxylase
MKSRERVIKALSHEEPDRVPIDLGAMGCSGIAAMAYNKLKKYLRIKGGSTKVIDMWQQLAKPELEILERFHVDTIGIWPRSDWKPSQLPDGSDCEIPEGWESKKLEDGSEVQLEQGYELARRPKDGIYFDPIYHPLKDATIEDLDTFVWPSPFSFYKMPDPINIDIYLNGLEDEAKYWYYESDLALVGNFGGSIFEAAYGLRGFEQFMMDMMINRNFAEKLLDRLVEVNIEYFKRYIDCVGEYVQVIMVGGEDIGTQNGLEISPNLYREIIKPRQKNLWQFIKQNSDAFLLVHSCGSIADIIDDYADAGIDVINPVQISAKGMNPEYLKQKYGDKISFWGGGCDTQHVLPFEGPEKVKEEVRKNISIFAPGGGFVFNQVHDIQYNISPENIVALFDAAYGYVKYPLRSTDREKGKRT